MEEKLVRVEGTVAAIVFQNQENGYTVLKLRGERGGGLTAVGCLPGVSVGERLVLTGNWTSHQSYGEQFKAETAERSLPDTASAIFDYLASGAVKGVGAKTARLIVTEFGRDSLRVIEESPEELTRIKGITQKRALEIHERLRQQTGLRQLMEFLVANGARPYAAARLYRNFGEDAREELRRNPYLLAGDEYGMDFFEADKLAMALGFAGDSPERAEAAVLFEMRHNLMNGHVFLPRDKLLAATAQLIGVAPEVVGRAAEDLCDGGFVCREQVAGVDALYLDELYEAETAVAERLRRMAKRPTEPGPHLDSLIQRAEYACGIAFAEKQREAVKAAAESFLLVLTGGPGTGKTTTVRGILEVFDELGFTTLLTAPTGRAAKRLSELTGRDAQTVHRLLGAGPVQAETGASWLGYEGREFEKCASDPLHCDAVVLDETSMMDISLMASLLDALPEGARLVLVGDADQLPSVGPGNVFSDLIRSGAAPVVALTEIFRQAQQSAIVRSAHMINRGQVPPLKNGGDFFFLQRQDPQKLVETVTGLVAKRLPENMGIPQREIQILCPSRKGGAGTKELNKAVQAAVNPPSPDRKERAVGEKVFRVGDRVMQVKNNYDAVWTRVPEGTLPELNEDGELLNGGSGTGLYNGDVGYIEAIDEGRGVVWIRFEDRLSPYPFEQLEELEPAYAVTVHKSQGSEYRAVVLCLPRTAPGLVTRGLLYTAVTRARELLVVVGDPEVFRAMTENDKRQRRYSGLRARLCGEIG